MYNPLSILLAAIRAILVVISLAFVMLPFVIVTAVLGNEEKRSFKVRRFWVKICRLILGITGSVKGKVPNETALYVCNHRSFSDPLIVASHVDAYVIAKAEVEDLPLIGKGAKMTGVIYVERDNKDSRSAVRQKMVETLLADKNVLVYPEGTTNGGFKTKAYKKGTFSEAAANGIPVVPIVLEYKKQRDLWDSRGMVKHHFRQFGKLLTQYRMEIGPVLRYTDGEELRSAAENWTNERIAAIHSDWNSVFTP